MHRISSESSSVRYESNSPIPSLSQSYKAEIESADVYWYTLRLMVLEYVNEPRFQKMYVRKTTPQERQDEIVSTKHNRRVSWFSGSSVPNRGLDETDVVQKCLLKLEQRLSLIAMNKVKVGDDKLRRSLLKLYNDVFLNPDMGRIMKSVQRFEELIVYFTKASNGELNKLVVDDIQQELYKQVSYFIDLLIELAATDITPEIRAKLNQYKDSVKPSKKILKEYSPSTSRDHLPSSNLVDVTVKPTFRLNEVTHSSYFMKLFQKDPVSMQQDIIKVMNEAVNSVYCQELRLRKEKLNKDEVFDIEDFESERDFNLWKNFEVGETASLIDRFNVKGDHAASLNGSTVIIPPNARSTFVSLVCKILRDDSSQNSNTLNFSQAAMFFITKASKYWRLDYHSTFATLVYSAANLTILKEEDLNIQLAENVMNFIRVRILKTEDNMDTAVWNALDRREWLENLIYTANRCTNTIDYLLTALFSNTKPKFSSILAFYYSNIEADPSMVLYKQQSNALDRKMIKRFHRTIFKVSEQFYISLLDTVPKDDSIEIQHIQDVAEQIIEQVKSIQKRYNRPLLDKVMLAHECATVLIEAFGSDASTMIKRVEKYNISKRGESIAPADALEAYSIFKELRNIYSQIQPDKPFPCKLEKLFVKYVTILCDEVSGKILKVIDSSIKNETWEVVNEEANFSSSVFDIFKMINESIGLFKRLEWENDYQIAKVITFLLKSFSDGLHFYSNTLIRMVEDDLIQDDFDIQEDENKDPHEPRSSLIKSQHTWSFHGMKNALSSTPTVAVPRPYQFKNRTCVLLSNLESMIAKINDLDEQLNAERLSELVQNYETDRNKKRVSKGEEQQLHQLYTIRVIKADNIKGFSNEGLSNGLVSLVDTSKQREIGKTRVVRKSTNPNWDEEFEIEIPVNHVRSISMMVWHRPSGKFQSLGNYDLCGKCSLLLDPKRFTDDGFPNELTLELDTQGKLYLNVSLESEKIDALFSIGRAYRTLTRARDRAIELIISKFSAFVGYAFSRETLKKVCGANGTIPASNDAVYDAILPLFDYLNSNLNVLASTLSQDLLFKVMLRAWSCILKAADSLLLPPLSMARSKRLSGSKNFWGNAMSNALGNTYTVPGYGRALTQREMETTFAWLNALCVDFFHNNGEGPPLSALKNNHYQTLLLIPAYYDKSAVELKEEAERLSPNYLKFLRQMTFGTDTHRRLSKRLVTLARKGTVMANASKKSRTRVQKEIEREENDPLERSTETLDIIYRILMVKGELDYVHQQLSARTKVRKSIATEKLVKAAVKGQKLKYKK